MSRVLSNELSWSVSRWQQFLYCQRAYYYNYYGSWGGWDYNAPERARQLYVLKNVKSLLMWAGSIVHELIQEALEEFTRSRQPPKTAELQEKARLKLRQGWIESVSREWLKYPKKTNLFELYYGDGKSLPKEQTDYVRERVYNSLEAFANSGFVADILQVPYLQWKSIDRLDSFQLNGCKVWGAIDFAYIDNGGKLHIVDWKTGGENPASLRLQLACYALMAMDKWQLPLEDIELHGVFLNDGGRKSDYPMNAESLVAIKDQILGSIETLKRKLRDPEKNLAEEDDFEFSGYPQNCQSCNFRAACPCVTGEGS
ncbi:MAG: PD-(D/E)XK nuclease family protein [Lentisphaeria bacterium]|nr:PD-(D/E)XK nuclease family protein [Lentisphaerota bacterium]